MKEILDAIQSSVLSNQTANMQHAKNLADFITNNFNAEVANKDATYRIKSKKYSGAKICLTSDPDSITFELFYKIKKHILTLETLCDKYGETTYDADSKYYTYKLELRLNEENLEEMVRQVLFRLFETNLDSSHSND